MDPQLMLLLKVLVLVFCLSGGISGINILKKVREVKRGVIRLELNGQSEILRFFLSSACFVFTGFLLLSFFI